MSRNRILSIAVALPMVSLALAAVPAMAADGSQGVVGNQTPAPLPKKEGEAKMGDGVRLHEGISKESRSLQAPSAGAAAGAATGVEGVDVSSWQGANVDWTGLWNAGNRFAYVKATEGGEYKNPYLGSQLPGAQNVGMKAGAYHFALPNKSSGAAQATHFLNNGGSWTANGKTLPGVLDVEWNPYSGTNSCYGLDKAQLSAWIRDFTATYKAATGLDAIVYTSTLWWNQCVGSDAQISSTNKLWLASYNTSIGALPTGWNTHTIWQYTDKGAIVGDHNNFNGTEADLQALTVRPEPPVGVVSAASNEAGGSERVRWGDYDGDKRPDYITVADNGAINVYLNHGGDPAGANGWQPVGQIAGGITNDRS
ncbi:GH25 family lysozyme, partial [Streptomyces sp. NPDC051183]